MQTTPPPYSVGDIMQFHRSGISHMGLYVGHDQVIHLWAPIDAGAFKVRIDSLPTVLAAHQEAGHPPTSPTVCTQELDAKMWRGRHVAPFRGEEAVRRARTRLGNPRFSLFRYNCEHFVTWARYGVATSPQAGSHVLKLLAGSLIGLVALDRIGKFVAATSYPGHGQEKSKSTAHVMDDEDIADMLIATMPSLFE